MRCRPLFLRAGRLGVLRVAKVFSCVPLIFMFFVARARSAPLNPRRFHAVDFSIVRKSLDGKMAAEIPGCHAWRGTSAPAFFRKLSLSLFDFGGNPKAISHRPDHRLELLANSRSNFRGD